MCRSLLQKSPLLKAMTNLAVAPRRGGGGAVGGDHTDPNGKPMCSRTPATGFMERWSGKMCRMRISEGVCCRTGSAVNQIMALSGCLHVRQPSEGLATHRHVFSLEQPAVLGVMKSPERDPISPLWTPQRCRTHCTSVSQSPRLKRGNR